MQSLGPRGWASNDLDHLGYGHSFFYSVKLRCEGIFGDQSDEKPGNDKEAYQQGQAPEPPSFQQRSHSGILFSSSGKDLINGGLRFGVWRRRKIRMQ
jgi:hypothetical protein